MESFYELLLGDYGLNLATAAFVGAVLGLERDVHGKAAGLRTSMLIVLGAMLFSNIAVHVASPALDPTRVAANIAAGIGFLGAGVIIKAQGEKIYGLTTAAQIWVCGAMGAAIGLNLRMEALLALVVVVFVTWILRPFSKALSRWGNARARAMGDVVIDED